MRQKTGETMLETGEPCALNGASTVRGRGVGKGLAIVPRRRPMLHISEVADRLVTLMEQGPAGRVPDMGGPQILTIEEMTQTYLRIRGRKATVRSEPPPRAQFDVFRSGINLTPDHAEGTITWETFLHRLYDG